MFTARRSTLGPRWRGSVMASSVARRAPVPKETRIVDAAAAAATTDDGRSLGIPFVRIL